MPLQAKDLTNEDFILTFFSFLFLLLPGIAAIYTFENEMFLTLDWIKLVLIGTAITLPISLLNILLSIVAASRNKNEKSAEAYIHFSLGTIIAGVSLYVALAINYFRPMILAQSILFATISDIIVFSWIIMRSSKK